MIVEHNKAFKRFLFFSDLSIVVVSFVIGYFMRGQIYDLRPLSFYIGFLPILLIIWGSLLYYFGMYRSNGVRKISEIIIIVFKTTVIGFIVFGSYVFVLHIQEDVSRLFMGLTFSCAAILITVEKLLLLYLYRLLSRKGTSFKSAFISFRSVLIVGTGKKVEQFIDLINSNPDWGIRIMGIVNIDSSLKREEIKGYGVIGSINDILNIIHNNVVDEVVFIVPYSRLGEIEDAMLFCEREGLSVNLAVNFLELKFTKARQTSLGGFPLLTFESTYHKVGMLFFKRVSDFIASIILLVILSPLLILIALIIKLASPGPVFFKQERCGLYGRRFIFYKFRTMFLDAESQLEGILDFNEMEGPVFKMTNDPRITVTGRFLRKFSLDELPQIWNVFMGEMSLVGPRPPLPEEVEKYDNWQRRKLSMRPGITCLWQIGGRSEVSDFNEWMRLDLEYIDNWSLWLDFMILLKTIPAVLTGRGAR